METRPHDKVNFGLVLREAVAIFLRRLPIVVLALIALGIGCVLVLVAIGHCAMSASCMPSDMFGILLGWIETIRRAGDVVASWIVLTVALPALYGLEARRSGALAGPELPRRRVRSLIARCFLYVVVATTLDSLLTPVFHRVSQSGPDYIESLLWLRRLVLVWMFAYIDMRLVLYPASAMGAAETDGFVRCWRRTRALWRPLFLLFFVAESGFVLLNVGIGEVMRRDVHLWPLARWLSTVSLFPDTYLRFVLPGIAGYVVGTVVATLFFGAISVAVNRQANEIDVPAAVFD